jgi:signal transduction histidine kinase
MAIGHLIMGSILLLSALILRRWPVAAVVLTMIGALGVALDTGARQPVVLILIAATAAVEVCYIAGTRPPRSSITAAALVPAAFVAVWLAPFGESGYPHETALVAVVLMTVIAWLIGNSIRQAHQHTAALRERSAADAVTAERLRIARELHDMVAHSIGIIAIQAGAGSRVIDAQPGQAKDALVAIETTSRETLAGLRRMLTGLRRAEPEAAPGPGPRDPAPGLADIDRLAATSLDAGVLVEVRRPAGAAPLPADIDLAAYRIIQEAITNVVRHAGASQCLVTIDQGAQELTIEVTDDGRGGVAGGTGFGLVGMRERAGLLGGEFAAGPRPGGGFRVAARLPVPVPAGR